MHTARRRSRGRVVAYARIVESTDHKSKPRGRQRLGFEKPQQYCAAPQRGGRAFRFRIDFNRYRILRETAEKQEKALEPHLDPLLAAPLQRKP